MPIIECNLIKGYDQHTRKLLGERLTDAACATIGAHPDLVIVMVKEAEADNYMRGRVNRTPARAPEQPDVIVRRFLDAMEQRDLELASTFLAEDFKMIFPGNKQFHQLDELITWAKARYQWVNKTYDGFDTSLQGTQAIVTCFGYLHGVWLDGTSFEKIRFIDRFTVENEKITFQQVWNDMGEIMKKDS